MSKLILVNTSIQSLACLERQSRVIFTQMFLAKLSATVTFQYPFKGSSIKTIETSLFQRVSQVMSVRDDDFNSIHLRLVVILHQQFLYRRMY